MADPTTEFEAHRTHLRAVAYRLLGSVHEADDAVQEAWLRLSRSDPDEIDNLGGWLTTVVSRICLDQLRRRATRREDVLDERTPVPGEAVRPEDEAVPCA
jgi:RNA polymerase sigma-70 factor (ECF subfamily)